MRFKSVLGAAVLTSVAGLAFTGTASADVVKMAPHETIVTTVDNVKLKVGHIEEQYNRVAPLTRDGMTKEGFITNRAYTDVLNGTQPVHGGVLRTGLQIGCTSTLQGVTAGIGGELGIGGQGGIEGGWVPSPVIGLNPSAGISPSIQASIKPGEIQTIPLGEKPLEAPNATITVRDVHYTISGCLGMASARTVTWVEIKTPTADDNVAVYGDAFDL